MASLANWFSFGTGSSTDTELPNIFPLAVDQAAFVVTDVEAIYDRILTDVLERTEGLPAEREKLLWDNCVASEKPDGLVSMLSKAMTARAELFLVFDAGIDLVREATPQEAAQIKADFLKAGKSSAGIFVTFKKFKRADMVKLYSALEYCDVAALYKALNVSKAVQLKLTDLRGSVALTDKADVITQAKAIAKGLADGKDVMLDAKDEITTATPDLTAINSAMDFIDRKRSFYLGLPSSWITGAQSKTMNDTGEADAKAVERGLKGYFFSIVKPVLEALFDAKVTFKSDDFRQLTGSLEALKTFELTGEEFLSSDNKLKVINKLFGLPAGEKGDPPPKVEPVPAPAPGVTPPKPGAPPAKPAAV